MKVQHLFFLNILVLSSCSMSDMPNPMVMDDAMEMNMADESFIAEGTFIDGAHATVGKAQVKLLENGDRRLIFENFMTDPGPDLRIYLSDDKKASNYVEITNVVENGDLTYIIPTEVDLKEMPYVLVWCKEFAVLFGSAELNIE